MAIFGVTPLAVAFDPSVPIDGTMDDGLFGPTDDEPAFSFDFSTPTKRKSTCWGDAKIVWPKGIGSASSTDDKNVSEDELQLLAEAEMQQMFRDFIVSARNQLRAKYPCSPKYCELHHDIGGSGVKCSRESAEIEKITGVRTVNCYREMTVDYQCRTISTSATTTAATTAADSYESYMAPCVAMGSCYVGGSSSSSSGYY